MKTDDAGARGAPEASSTPARTGSGRRPAARPPERPKPAATPPLAARPLRPAAPPATPAPPADLRLPPHRRLLAFFHRWLGDRAGGRGEFVSTTIPKSLAGEAFDDPDRLHAYDYRPTPRAVIGWALEELRPDYPRTTFVDFGSGRGRAVLEAARKPFLRCVGIEISPSLHEDAEQNLRHWPRSRMACREVDYVRDSILRAPLPEGPLLIWMFNPVTDRLMMRLAARLAAAGSAGQPITLVYLDPRHDMPFRQAPAFRERPIRDRRLRYLSPYRIRAWHCGPQIPPQS